MTDRLRKYFDLAITASFPFVIIVSCANIVIIPLYAWLNTSASLVLITDIFVIGLCLFVRIGQYINDKFTK